MISFSLLSLNYIFLDAVCMLVKRVGIITDHQAEIKNMWIKVLVVDLIDLY